MESCRAHSEVTRRSEFAKGGIGKAPSHSCFTLFEAAVASGVEESCPVSGVGGNPASYLVGYRKRGIGLIGVDADNKPIRDLGVKAWSERDRCDEENGNR